MKNIYRYTISPLIRQMGLCTAQGPFVCRFPRHTVLRHSHIFLAACVVPLYNNMIVLTFELIPEYFYRRRCPVGQETQNDKNCHL